MTPPDWYKRRVIDAVPALLAYIDADLHYQFVNATYERWFGHDVGSLRGRHMPEVIGVAAFASVRHHLDAVLAGHAVQFEQEIPYTGGTRWIGASYTPDVVDGRVVGFSVVVLDHTERRRIDVEHAASAAREKEAPAEAERQRVLLRTVFEQAPAGVAIFEGPGLVCTFANPTHLATSGQRVAVGQSARDTLEGPGAAPLLASFDHVMATGQPASLDDLPIAGADGRKRHLAVRLGPLRGATGEVEGVFSFFVETTEQVRARARSTSMLAIATALSEAFTPARVGVAVVDRIHEELGASATVLFQARDGEAPRLLAHRGIPAETVDRYATLPPDAPVPLVDALRTGEPVWVEDRAELLARYPAVARSPVAASALQAVVALPFRLGSRTVGGMGISFAQPRRFDGAKREFLLSIAGECALAMERAWLFEQNAVERERFRAVFDGSLDPMIIADDELRMVDVNPAACRLYRMTREELIGRTGVELVAENAVDPGALREGFLEQGEQRGELAIRRGDGSTAIVEYSATANIVPGRHLSVLRDVSEQRRTAEILRFLVDASDALGSSLDTEARFQALVDMAVPRMADWAVVDLPAEDGGVRMVAVAHADPAKVALAHDLRRRLPPRQDDPQGVGRVLRTGEAEIIHDIPDAMLVASIPDPELLHTIRELGLASAMTLPLVARGATVGALTLIAAESRRRFDDADVTVATEVARRAGVALDHARAYREAQEANRLKDEFLGTVSHELRTPLNAILGWVTLLRGKKSGDQASLARGLDTIERNARAQARLIEDVLDVSRIISGKLLIRRQAVDGEAVLRAALAVVEPMANGKGVILESSIEPGVTLVGDADRLQQVAWNLLSNAVKFTPAGGVVRVGLAREGSAVAMRVSDSGAGIAFELQPFVFDRFRQADSSPSRRHGGLGLGLAIARHLVELHGGTIQVESAGEGSGSTFTVRLPIRALRASEPTDRAPIESSVETVEVAPSLVGVRVLVCDDDPDAREIVQEVLSSAGAIVQTASSSAEALAGVGTFRPTVVVSDIGMPGQDGYQLLRSLRARPASEGGAVPAIALTAYARASDEREALDAGFQVHLAKPIREALLVAAVARLAQAGAPGWGRQGPLDSGPAGAG